MISYRVYSNGGSGGPVDYSTPLQDSPSTSFAYATIPPGAWTFGIRSYDPTTGIEEQNTDATVRVIIGDDFIDRSAVPNGPIGLTAWATAGGGCRLDFAYSRAGQGGSPMAFHAFIWPSGSVDWTDPPAATLATSWGPGDAFRHVSMTLSGLSDGVDYEVGVRAANASGDDGNTATVSVTGKGSGPASVAGLSATPAYRSDR